MRTSGRLLALILYGLGSPRSPVPMDFFALLIFFFADGVDFLPMPDGFVDGLTAVRALS